MSNPLIASPDATDWASGAGFLSDGKSLADDLMASSKDWVSIGLDGVSETLDILGLVTDPLGGFFQAGVGWLIEHIGFLREPFDALLGDPAQITAIAATWLNVAQSLEQVAGSVGDEIGSVSQWQGDAADAYRKAAENYQALLYGGMTASGAISGLVTAAGVLIGACRDWVFKTLGAFVERVVIYIVSALASSWFTFGASIEVAVVAVEVDGEMQAVSIETQTVQVSVQVTVYTGRLGTICQKVLPILDKLKDWGETMENSPLTKVLDGIDKSHVVGTASGVNDTRTHANGG